MAREAAEPQGIDYRSLSASRIGDEFPPDTFDLVTACMSLHDVADVQGALGEAFGVLRPGGRLAFSVPHPATDTPYREWERDRAGRKRCLKVDRYFESGPSVCHWNMPRLRYRWSTPYWRHTLTQWTEFVTDAGFVIRTLQEPLPTPEQVAAKPHLDDCARVPFFLILGLSKPGAAARIAPAEG